MATEKKLQNAILRQFATRPELRLWRANVGTAVPISYVKQIEKSLLLGDREEALTLLRSAPVISFGVKGQADLTGILPGGTRLEIEVKGEGGRQTEDQQRYQRMINNKGGLYILAREVDDVGDEIYNFIKEGKA